MPACVVRKSPSAGSRLRHLVPPCDAHGAATALIGGGARLWRVWLTLPTRATAGVGGCATVPACSHDLGDLKVYQLLYGEIASRDRVSKLAGIRILRIYTVGSVLISYSLSCSDVALAVWRPQELRTPDFTQRNERFTVRLPLALDEKGRDGH